MLRKVLIANRGEIAIRVMRACRELGIRTVAVYSEADAKALHVRYADEACLIGPAVATRSYLNIEAILQAALTTDADAIHPGYGFLAENPDFAKACQDAGLTFIGPNPQAIELLGDKAKARQLARDVGVPTVPGTPGAATLAEARAFGKEIGFPIVLKAAAGGGGRGIRIVRNPEELESAWQEASREASAAFDDDRLYLEKYLERPRHIEVQILADIHGHTVHLFERECSLQRRRQKLWEEAPSASITPELRTQLCQAAVDLAQAANYSNAGTVEFLLGNEGFYFLEMNTRIQVEHPVTELVTGIDLIKAQLHIAAGHALPWDQQAIELRGHAIECRINAEDPARGFFPSPGCIDRLVLPAGPGVRCDFGYHSGDEVLPYYDSLVGKLIAWGYDRSETLARIRRALEELVVEGVMTTALLHLQLASDPAIHQARYHVQWLDERLA